MGADDVAGKAIYINGYLYVGNKEGEGINPGTVDTQSQSNAIRKQKIINAIRSREIFRQVNSDNIVGHYGKYDDSRIGTGFDRAQIGDAIEHTKPKKQALNSPKILGGIDGDNFDDDMFNDVLFRMTGIKDTDSLYDAIRIIDSINIHSKVRVALSRGSRDAAADAVLSALGFPYKTDYLTVSLKAIQSRMGCNYPNWSQTLYRTTQKEGIDYDTKWQQFLLKKSSQTKAKDIRDNNATKELNRMRKEGIITLKQYDKMLNSRQRDGRYHFDFG